MNEPFKKSIPDFFRDAKPVNILTSPVLYVLAVPLVLLDLAVTVYQTVCFPGYGIAKVSRSKYIIHDRHHLGYLNSIEKLNCFYCAYANGLIAYVREVAARTEQYFCPIKHLARRPMPHERYPNFFEYGDAQAYRKGLQQIREDLKKE